MLTSLRITVTTTWLVLFLATAVSWYLVPDGKEVASVAAGLGILTIALFKVRLILLYFMELKTAPVAWRLTFELWVLALWTALAVIWLHEAPP